VALIEAGGKVVQETRLYNPETDETVSMRSKEHAHDYRYFPEPDLVPLRVSDAWIAKIRDAMPELPASRRARFVAVYHLSEYDAEWLTQTREISEYFEETATRSDPLAAAKWVMGDVAALPKQEGKPPVSPEHLAALVNLVSQGRISGKLAKEIFPKMVQTGESPEAIMQREGLESIRDEGAVGKIIDEVIAAHPTQVEQYRGGRQQVMGFLVGQVMKASRGQADPAAVNRMLKEKLG
jgi:aspartyl-tRNA(Asn)/glutamyl-tRNA(Gln) amidotransferase subunit B